MSVVLTAWEGGGDLTPDLREGVRVYQELGEVAIDPNLQATTPSSSKGDHS